MNEDQFHKLWQHIEQQSTETRKEVAELHSEVRGIYTHLDEIRNMLDTDELERLSTSAQQTRLQDRVEKHELRITHLEQKHA